MKLAAEAKSPVFYDFEASCIGGLPIEIGWARGWTTAGIVRPPCPFQHGPGRTHEQRQWVSRRNDARRRRGGRGPTDSFTARM